jgi:hypothetical protein
MFERRMRHSLVEFGFKVHRAFEADRAVEPAQKSFDPFRDDWLHLQRARRIHADESSAFELVQKLPSPNACSPNQGKHNRTSIKSKIIGSARCSTKSSNIVLSRFESF